MVLPFIEKIYQIADLFKRLYEGECFVYNKKISIVVPVYNVEKYIRECIESILSQTYSNLEIILVDDGSTDSSGQICDEYQKRDSRIHTIHQKNKGLLNARYVGVLEATCEYITFVDSDDWIEVHTYETMVEYLEDGFDVVACGIIRYLDADNQALDINLVPAGKYFKEEIEKYVLPFMIWNQEKGKFGLDPSLCTKLMKRELLLKHLEKVKSLGIYYGEDSAVAYPMLKAIKSIVVLNQCMYYHRQRRPNVVSPYMKEERFMDKLWKLYSFLMDEFREHETCRKQIDYFYVHSIGYLKRIYGDYVDNDKFIFPFSEIPRNSKIVLYGARSVGQTYYSQLRRTGYCDIVAWVDKGYQDYQKSGMINVSGIETIKNIEFDYIIIAVSHRDLCEKIKSDLISLGVAKDKIVYKI